MSNKPSLPKGTRDFNPLEMNKRNYVMDTIKVIFRKYGFKQIETPSMEQLSVLTGKYGDEGDQLIFKILNSGDYLKATSEKDFLSGSQALSTKVSEKGLRYDLTVPFARHVVMNQNEINFPFRRFQVQPVWRADRPQKGRYREFYQCDADVIGTNSIVAEGELISMALEILNALNLSAFKFRINNRKILNGIAQYLGQADKTIELCTSIDKLDKIGTEGVVKELKNHGFKEESVEKLFPLLNIEGDNYEKLNALEGQLTKIENAIQGINEIREALSYCENLKADIKSIYFDPKLARGLGYYTGCIFEITLDDVKIGSISGGGRYDDLTGVFGLKNISGVGISFGIDRIIDSLNELDLFPDDLEQSTFVLVTVFSEEVMPFALKILSELRSNGIKSEVFPEATKMKKQFSYANNNNIPYVLTIGPEEVKKDTISLKEMESGKQTSIPQIELIPTLKQKM
ncbi:MAG: histidine--tRNA ligase [Bacteroidota bacterium]